MTGLTRRPAPMLWLWASAAAMVLASCSSGDSRASANGKTRVSTTTSSTSTSTTTTVAPTTTAPPPPPGLGPGASGAQVADLEQRLNALHFDVGAVDDKYDQNTAYGVMAFQKVTGMGRTGRATDDVIAAVAATSSPPAGMVAGGGANRVEIDLGRQVLFLFEGDTLTKVLNASTGNNARFCSEGYCRRAVTPEGAYRIFSQRRGWERSPLGRLYNSQYFNGGIAIHGSPSVPGNPASHGCVRIPMAAAEWFPSKVSIGTPVYVVGKTTPAPLPPPAPPAPPPPSAAAAAPAPSPATPSAPPPPVPTLAPPVTFKFTPTTAPATPTPAP